MRRFSKVKILAVLLCASLMMNVCGCTFSDGPKDDVVQAPTTEAATVGATDGTTAGTSESVTEADTETDDAGDETFAEDDYADEPAISLGDVTPYEGEAFIYLDGNLPRFTDEEKACTDTFEEYSDLDSLGRCGTAFANVCEEIMPTEERGEIGDVRPTGWHTVKYPDLIEDNYLYNRSHLIAYSLAGENANEKNLITGTRYLNQETMQIFELKVLDYVRSTKNHVLYRVTPDFKGDNLVASGVEMEAWSVEDGGEGICFNVYCYNVQPGIIIDYATGDSEVDEEYVASEDGSSSEADGSDSETGSDDEVVIEITTDETTEGDGTADDTSRTIEIDDSDDNSDGGSTSFADKEQTFILNTNSMKIHLPTCSSVDDMSEKNKKECVSTINKLKELGYDPCGRCLAEYK